VLRSLFISGTAFVVCCGMARRQALPQADSIDEFGPATNCVLFLRPFRGEKAPFSQSDDRHGRHPLKAFWVDPNEEFPSFERYVGPELSARIGPIIGLGAPGDRLPPEGPVACMSSAPAPSSAGAQDLMHGRGRRRCRPRLCPGRAMRPAGKGRCCSIGVRP